MEKKKYDEEFKIHIVELYESGQKQAHLAKEYNINPTSIATWVKNYRRSGSFKAKDNMTEEQKEIKRLKSELKDKQMEIDVLKKAMVIMSKN